jgi:hypothetical protein
MAKTGSVKNRKRRAAPVPVTFPDHDEGAPRPSSAAAEGHGRPQTSTIRFRVPNNEGTLRQVPRSLP